MMDDFSPAGLKTLLERARSLRSTNYTQRVSELKDFWNDRSGAHLAADIESTFSDPDIRGSVARSGLTLPLVRRIVRKLSRLYRSGPVRRIRPLGPSPAGTDAETLRESVEQRYRRITLDGELDTAMRTAQELFTLTGLSIIRTGHDSSLFFEVYSGDELYLVPPECGSLHDLSGYGAVIVPGTGPDGKPRFTCWTPLHRFSFDESGRITDDFGRADLSNPYGRIPFVRIDGRTGELYPESPESLVRTNRVLNFALTELFHTIKFQCFGQPVWVSDEEARPDIKVGVQHLIHVVKRDAAAAGDFRFESPNAPIEPVKEAVFEVARLAALLEGVPADTVDARGRVESGVARWLAHADSLENRAAEVIRFRNAEREVFRTVAAVIAHHRPGPDENLHAEQFTVETDFTDSVPELTPSEERSADEADLKLGVVSPVDLLRRRNPDLSRLPDDEVLRLWRKNLALTRETEDPNGG